MTKIVLHIGPGKCGSSSIQYAINSKNHSGNISFEGIILPSKFLQQLDSETPPVDAENQLKRYISNLISQHKDKTLVISNESAFKRLQSILNVAKVASDLASKVVVIAYVRRQSDFIVSSFNQWHFRSPERIKETADVLKTKGIDPELFWGIERHLIGCILSRWRIGRQLSGHIFFDWSESISERMNNLEAHRIPFSVGVVPRSGFSHDLLQDFWVRAGINHELAVPATIVKNNSFHPGMIEAVYSAIELGLEMPGPHAANQFFAQPAYGQIEGISSQNSFVTALKNYIDTAFEAKNLQLAEIIDAPYGYFTPDVRVSEEEIKTIIQEEVEAREKIPKELLTRDRRTRSALANVAWTLYKSWKDSQI